MQILVAHTKAYYRDEQIITYSDSLVREIRAKGHAVTEVSKDRLSDDDYKAFDLLVDIDCGRDLQGNYFFHAHDGPLPIKTAQIFIDTHGWSDLHKRVARHVDHVFFAVWDKRHVFEDLPSVTWFPNFTDLEIFDGEKHNAEKTFDFCFFGSKGGIDRADKLVDFCKQNGYTYDVDEVGRRGKHRWPRTANRMAACRFGFNHGQKHDGPNLRVMETMAMKIPLICDNDPRDGKGYLFEPWQHYIPYEAYSYEGLEERMKWCLSHPKAAAKIAENAYNEIKNNHLAKHRVAQLLEVVT